MASTTVTTPLTATVLHHPTPFLTTKLFQPLSFPIVYHRRHIFPHPTISCATTSSNSPTQPPPAEVEMFLGHDGVYSARQPTVIVLWDLDNKPPRFDPYSAAVSLRSVSSLLGRVSTISAYANRHAFSYLPSWVASERRERRELDVLERRGISVPSEPYVCGVCGRRCPTRPDLARHFRQLHQRERKKKLSRLSQLKGKKRQRYRERFISNNTKYEEAERELVNPKVGYGLASELKRAGVFIRTVKDKPQAADAALEKQIRESMARGVDWMVLVSDDSDFTEMVRDAREAEQRARARRVTRPENTHNWQKQRAQARKKKKKKEDEEDKEDEEGG